MSNAKCTICNIRLNQHNLNSFRSHPQLKVLICERCSNLLDEEQWSQGSDGKDKYCRWCGDGGTLLLCDFCPNAYHRECLRRNLKREFMPTDYRDWKCPLCDPQSIRELQMLCLKLIGSFESASTSATSNSDQKLFDLMRMIKDHVDICAKFSSTCKRLIRELQDCTAVDKSEVILTIADNYGVANMNMWTIANKHRLRLQTGLPTLVRPGAVAIKIDDFGEASTSVLGNDNVDHLRRSSPIDEINNFAICSTSKPIRLKRPSLGYLLMEEFASIDNEIQQNRHLSLDDNNDDMASVEISIVEDDITVPESDTSIDEHDEVQDHITKDAKSKKEDLEIVPKHSDICISPALFDDDTNDCFFDSDYNVAVKNLPANCIRNSQEDRNAFLVKSNNCKKDRNTLEKIEKDNKKGRDCFKSISDDDDKLLNTADRLLKSNILSAITSYSKEKYCEKTKKQIATSIVFSSSDCDEDEENSIDNSMTDEVRSDFDMDAIPKSVESNEGCASYNYPDILKDRSDDDDNLIVDKCSSDSDNDISKKQSESIKKQVVTNLSSTSEFISDDVCTNFQTKSKKFTDREVEALLRLPHSQLSNEVNDARTKTRLHTDCEKIQFNKRSTFFPVQPSVASANTDDVIDIADDSNDSVETDVPSDIEQPVSLLLEKHKTKNKSLHKTNVMKRTRKHQMKRKKIMIDSSSDDDIDEIKINNDDEVREYTEGVGDTSRKNIRKIIEDKDLRIETKEAQRVESIRIERLRENQNEYSFITLEDFDSEGSMIFLPIKYQKVKKVVLEADVNSGEPVVEVYSSLVEKLKPHQAEGIKFLYDCVIESISKLDNIGSGAILAHCMGLGKSLQVISFLHTIFNDKRFNLKKVLIVSPLNAVLNWKNEFLKWLRNDTIEVFEMASIKENFDRAKMLIQWQKKGGVIVMSYHLFRMLSTGHRIKNKKLQETFANCLLNPGPDLVICDEGHMLKNRKTAIFQSMELIRTRRRICLTGTPLQNNLVEYHTMVSFVKPGLLGTVKEFMNRFGNPIKNGQHIDSTTKDVLLMKRRAHVLFDMLKGCVHRRDYSALIRFLPPKFEYILSVRLSSRQIELYRLYLRNVVGSTDSYSLRYRKSLLPDYNNLHRVWTHPYTLVLQRIERDKKIANDEEAIVEDEMISEGSEEEEKSKKRKISSEAIEENVEQGSIISNKEKSRSRAVSPAIQQLWYSDLVKEEDALDAKLSGKLMLLLSIIRKCEEIGDKLLVFSQSLITLNLIENILQEFESKGIWQEQAKNSLSYLAGEKWGWQFGLDYMRMDGSTGAKVREEYANNFNDVKNERTRLFLISTRAGGVGINLVAANRVVIFDASWNPSNDVQSIFRTYRFGQDKPVYVYRLIAQGTMEEKIYDRQVTKQSLSCRVIDEQQIDRHFTADDLEELYSFEPEDEKIKKKRPLPALPKDRLLADLLVEEKEWLCTYHDHDSLLQHHEEEQLSAEERRAAWEEYNDDRTGRAAIHKNRDISVAMELKLVKLVNQGDALIAQSGEEVQTSMGQVVAILRQRPEYSSDLPALVERVSGIIGEMQDKLRGNTGSRAPQPFMTAMDRQHQLYQQQQDAEMARQFPPYMRCQNEHVVLANHLANQNRMLEELRRQKRLGLLQDNFGT